MNGQNSYIDITFVAREDISLSAMISTLYYQLHLALVECGQTDVALCFPQAKKDLGALLRLQGPETSLQLLLHNARLHRLGDYIRIAPVRVVPADCDWYRIARKQPKRSAAKIRRMISRGGLQEAQAQELLENSCCNLKEPFVQIKSASTGQQFRLFISQTPAEPPTIAQTFSFYGLGGVVAWF